MIGQEVSRMNQFIFPPQTTSLIDAATTFGPTGGGTNEEGDEFSLNIPLLATLYLSDIPKGS